MIKRKHRTKRRKNRKIRVLFLAFILVFCIGWFGIQYRSLMLDTALKLARNTANEIINETVYAMLSEYAMPYEELINITYDEAGEITSLQANAANINLVKSQTALRVREALSKQDVQDISVPLGTMCASTLLSGRGPIVPCKSLMNSVPHISLNYHFDGAGINQTLHSIIMIVKVPLSVTLPLQDGETETTASFLIGETILVGEVPSSYTNVISDPEVADDIFNYGDAG